MAKIISTIKAILTRIIFAAHSLLAIWQVSLNENDLQYWVLSGPLLLLLFEGIFTLMIKKTQEWRWFCPSVFLYLASIVPAIWFLELDKVKRSLTGLEEVTGNKTHLPPALDNLLDETGIKVPKINKDTWTTLIEEVLMLILIIGRWMLPKGDLTRDQLSQLLLVYIGIAADIIEFIDSYKNKETSIVEIPMLVYLTLGIWSWSLLQFTIVLSATKARRPRGSGNHSEKTTDCCSDCCCGIEVWGIVLNVLLQDAPYLTVRLLIIFQYHIINYMNIFFTCKNSLVIILQIYRLYVVNAEYWKNRREQKLALKKSLYHNHKSHRVLAADAASSIYMITAAHDHTHKHKYKGEPLTEEVVKKKRGKKNKKNKRKDTGYSTASSQNLYSTKIYDKRRGGGGKEKKSKKTGKLPHSNDIEVIEMKKSKHQKHKDKGDKKKSKRIEAVIEESRSSESSASSNSTLPSYEVINEKRVKSKHRKRVSSSSSSSTSSSSSSSSSDSSSEE